jgi:hypothetical protein
VLKDDTDANQLITLAPVHCALTFGFASLLDGTVYVVGNVDNYNFFLQSDPVSAAWSTIAPTLSERIFGNSFVLGGCLHVVGSRGAIGSVERYNVDTDTWTMKANNCSSCNEVHVLRRYHRSNGTS